MRRRHTVQGGTPPNGWGGLILGMGALLAAILVTWGMFVCAGCAATTRRVSDGGDNTDQSVAAIQELTARVNAALEQYQAGGDISINDPVVILGGALVLLAGILFAARPMLRVVLRLLEIIGIRKRRSACPPETPRCSPK